MRSAALFGGGPAQRDRRTAHPSAEVRRTVTIRSALPGGGPLGRALCRTLTNGRVRWDLTPGRMPQQPRLSDTA
ncbi:hypothetical protein GCM10027070_05550 [Barrientosiimonas humi]